MGYAVDNHNGMCHMCAKEFLWAASCAGRTTYCGPPAMLEGPLSFHCNAVCMDEQMY